VAQQTIAVETAVIKPADPSDTNWRMEFSHGRMRIENRSLRDLIRSAYGLSAASQVINTSPWVSNEKFDIAGTFVGESAKVIDSGTADQRNAAIGELLRQLLGDRFHLKAHRGEVVMPVYVLTSATKKGTSIQPTQSKQGPTFFGIVGPPGKLEAHAVTMTTLASRLTSMRDAGERVVVDETGMPGSFDWSLRWAPDLLSNTSGNDESPSLFVALQEQLGLKLVSKKRPTPTVIVDQVSPATEN
jgi:uncharacterized protein (TIGR03435 family)